MITMEHVCKTYRIAKRNAGFSEACKALFHREYEEIHALKDVSFTIGDGEMVGYIGPNGAGKSSTIKILSGILTPDSGNLEGQEMNKAIVIQILWLIALIGLGKLIGARGERKAIVQGG